MTSEYPNPYLQAQVDKRRHERALVTNWRAEAARAAEAKANAEAEAEAEAEAVAEAAFGLTATEPRLEEETSATDNAMAVHQDEVGRWKNAGKNGLVSSHP